MRRRDRRATACPPHGLVPCAEEGAGDDAGVAGGAREGVAAHLDVVAEIAVAPGRPAAGRAGCLARAPAFEPGEVEIAVEAVESDAEIGGAGHGLGRGGEAEQAPGPRCGPRNPGVVGEVGERRRSGRPRLGEAVPERHAEGDVPACGGEFPEQVGGRVAPGAEVLGERGHGGTVPEPAVPGEQCLSVEGIEYVRVAGFGGNAHDGVREQFRIGVPAVECVNDFVSQGLHAVSSDCASMVHQDVHVS